MPAIAYNNEAKLLQIEALFIEKLEEWKSSLAKKVPAKTGEWKNSLAYRIKRQSTGWRIVLTQARHGFILGNLAKTLKKQAKRKGGSVKGADRYADAKDLPANSPLRQNPEKYSVFEAEKNLLRERLSEIAIREMLAAMGDVVGTIEIR